MKIAVIGAGIFGSTIAIKLADNGYPVDLFEREPDILRAASGINQYRLHRGYHYPRSRETGESSREAYPLFFAEYGDAIIDKNNHYYCVPKEKSKVSGAQFLQFCQDSDLALHNAELPQVNKNVFDVVIQGEETLVDPDKLREIVRERIAQRGINLMVNHEATAQEIEAYDVVINCTYANLNAILKNYPEAQREYQFEICEKLVIQLPESFSGVSAVVMDGPFFCIDPFGESGLHVMGNVVHAIHATNVGLFPEIPEEFKPLLNKGVITNPSITRFDKFIEAATYYMPEIAEAKHVGSMYTIRVVLPHVDATDERPTLVNKINDKVINVFSGKLGNCVQAAQEVVRLVKAR